MTDDTRSATDPEPAPEPVLTPGYRVPAQVPPAPEPAPAPADRLWIHAAWELALLVLLAGGIGLWWLLGRDTNLLSDPALLRDRLFAVAPLLLLATALAASIRVRAVNLAAGAVAALAALLFVSWEDESQLLAAALVVAVALAVTVALSVLVTVLKVPGWAASLGAAVAVLATATTVAEDGEFAIGPSAGGVLTTLPESTTVTVATELAWAVIGTVMAVSVLGGLIAVVPSVRRRLQACREAAAGPGSRDLPLAVTTGTGLLVSNLLAAGAGVLLVIPSEQVAGGAEVPASGLEAMGLALALAIVLLGGTSVWGRRGGVFGTLLAGLAVFAGFAAFTDLGWAAQGHWLLTGAFALGLLVNWLVEVLGSRPPAPAEPPLESITALADPEPPAATEEEPPPASVTPETEEATSSR
jgi:ribose/xylose/arabinose/galactoside ABC-type transport system permease subunit